MHFNGAATLDKAKLLQIAGLRLEEQVTPANFASAHKKLLDSGAFEFIAYEYQPVQPGPGYTLLFDVKEAPLYAFRFEELKTDDQRLRSTVLAAEPLFNGRLPASEAVIKRVAAKLQETASEAVVARVETGRNGELEVVFRPTTLPSVAEVRFTGNQTFDEKALQSQIAGAAIGALYSVERFRQILDNSVRPLYETKGRIRVQFPEIHTAPARDVKGVIVTVAVNEGSEYKLDEVLIEGAEKELLKQGKFRTDDVANFKEINEGIENMRQALRRGGFLLAKASSSRKIDDKSKLVDVTVEIDPGPQYSFGKLHVEGLDIQTEPHIRKLWTLKPGQPFNADYPAFFLARIRSDNILDSLGETKASETRNDAARTADVTLIFKGEKPAPKKEIERWEPQRPAAGPDGFPGPF